MHDVSPANMARRVRSMAARPALWIALSIGLGVAAAQARQPAPGPGAQARSAAGKALTVERIYGAPGLEGSLTPGIEWSPDGKRISYLERNELWTMDATTADRKILVKAQTLAALAQPEKAKAVQSTGLGRVQAGNYFWSPGGDSLLLVGSSDLVLLDLTTMVPKPLATGEGEIEDPKFSPDGKWVSFVRGSDLWVVNVRSGETRALTSGGSEEILKGQPDWVYPEELNVTTAYWWSPDSSKLAYYEMDERPVTRYPILDMNAPLGAITYTRFPQAGERNPTVRIGVVPVTGGDTKWMDTGAQTDIYLARVEWLPDSQQVAVERLNRAQNRLDLLFCDVRTGASRTILTETDRYWINISDDLYFFSDNRRFLWSSERTGFRHFYLYDVSGQQLEQLTSGDWGITGTSGFGPGAVSHPAVDEAHGHIYFLSNKDDASDTQLYRVSLEDKRITRITRESGTHHVIISPDDSAFVDVYSNAMTPPRQELDRTDGTRVGVINQDDVPELAEYHLSPIEFVNLPADDGTKLYAKMIKPRDFEASRKYPVLISIYGGPQVQEVRNVWGGRESLWLQMMAEKGYIIFTLDNRGSYNRGHAFETPIYHQLGNVELEDQLAGVKYLKSLPYVDGSRVGIWGWSYGAYMTLEAMCKAAEVFKAGIAVAPVSDWRLYDTIYTERYMGLPQENPENYRMSSPVNQVSSMKGKLMLAHGSGDDNVHFANTSELLSEFIEKGSYPTEVMIFPGRGHSIGDRSSRIQLFERMTEFLLKNL
jgi:dipeptidyl-peptidase-4